MDAFGARFNGIGRLFSESGLQRLRRAHVCVVGLGGVGSWAVEALARSGVGRLTLVDLDDICISNTNRQLHATTHDLGKPKVEVLEKRVLSINPECVVHPVHGFLLKSNAGEILGAGFDYVVDAIDGVSLKARIIASCRQRNVPVISIGAAGGRRDPTAIEVTDLAFSSHDRLLAQVRRKLRRIYAFPRGDHAFSIECVISREPILYPGLDGSVCSSKQNPDVRLDCSSGLGTASFVTGVFGLVAASRVVSHIAGSCIERAASLVE
jgi:tRNA A37 threonylcarbamoyladenosine dehydratase